MGYVINNNISKEYKNEIINKSAELYDNNSVDEYISINSNQNCLAKIKEIDCIAFMYDIQNSSVLDNTATDVLGVVVAKYDDVKDYIKPKYTITNTESNKYKENYDITEAYNFSTFNFYNLKDYQNDTSLENISEEYYHPKYGIHFDKYCKIVSKNYMSNVLSKRLLSNSEAYIIKDSDDDFQSFFNYIDSNVNMVSQTINPCIMERYNYNSAKITTIQSGSHQIATIKVTDVVQPIGNISGSFTIDTSELEGTCTVSLTFSTDYDNPTGFIALSTIYADTFINSNTTQTISIPTQTIFGTTSAILYLLVTQMETTIPKTVTISNLNLTFSYPPEQIKVIDFQDDYAPAYVLFFPTSRFRYSMSLQNGLKSKGVLSINNNNQNINGFYTTKDITNIKQYKYFDMTDRQGT